MDKLVALWAGMLVGAMVAARLVVAYPPPMTEDTMPYSDPYYEYDGMEMMCPMMDCGFVTFMLECDAIDTYTPETMINGVMCETCPQCRDFAYYRSLINSTLGHMQEMFERTLIMQSFLDENSNVIVSIGEFGDQPEVMADFRDLLKRNSVALLDYLMYDATHVNERLQLSGEKLTYILEGSQGEAMEDILNDYTRLKMTQMGQEMSGDIVIDTLTAVQLLQTIREQISQLTTRHSMIKSTIEETKPVLETLLALPEEEFRKLWEHDRTTARVAFKLLEKAKEAIKALLEMNMDGTASSLQMIIMEAYSKLLSFWEGPSRDILETHSVGSNTDATGQNTPEKIVPDGQTTGSTINEEIEGSGEEWEIHDENVNTLTNRESNLFFQWLSSRYIKQS